MMAYYLCQSRIQNKLASSPKVTINKNKLKANDLITVFSNISSIKDKLQCILVCKKWYKLMTENYLYKQLNFCDNNNFNKALDLFDRKPKFGNHVESLTIQSCEIDIVTMFLLSRQFPNTKHLYWTEDIRTTEERIKNDDISIKNPPHPLIYRRELRKWNQLKTINIRMERLPFLTMLLESSSLNSLTTVEISFASLHVDNYFGSQTTIKLRPIVKSLIDNIKNAPSLDRLVMICPVLDLSDMEELHANTTKLKTLHLNYIAISGGSTDNWLISTDNESILDNNGKVVTSNTANTVAELSIVFYHDISGIHDLQNDLKDTMTKWLVYIGCKYNGAAINLKGFGNQYLSEISEFHKPLLTMIKKELNTTEYHAFLHPITIQMMDALDAREFELKTLYLYTNTLTSLRMQLNIVKVSRQAKTICHLKINSKSGVIGKHSSILDSIVFGLSLHFESLYNLDITCTIFQSTLIKLLQKLPSLQVLSLDSVHFNGEENVAMVSIIRSKIQKLYLTLNCEINSTMQQLNQVMEFVIQSCPLLVEFSLSGSILLSEIRSLRLCFFYHEDLKTIEINIKGVHYYVFSWEDGKQGHQWKDYNELAEKWDPTWKKLHVDIAWRNKDAQLILAKAPVVEN
ncbi:uncharacterized protein EV154DRAFT_476289 [Mucor mucedo]|uniref:uncharacterized protein n=1 Tax=Mucor mucedo TaxID=29922 RepID=UPI00221EE53F|nr:uncharacterized protein EV154DRAFT_476289 [Mucor mucedo]KAI7896642.1 hypothetical protein EV154DRAFT_476289 [Mucor mucedo]